MLMENPERPLDKPLSPEKELMHFKAVVRSVMLDASKVLAHIELLVHGAEVEEQMSLLDHLPGLHTETMRKRELGSW